MTSSNTIPVDSATATAFASASPALQLEIQNLVSERLQIAREQAAKEELSQIMARMGKYAKDQGLTPEILEQLLRDE